MMWQHVYPTAVKRHRNEGMNLVYTDEWWVTMGTTSEVWKDKILEIQQQTFVAGLSTGLKHSA